MVRQTDQAERTAGDIAAWLLWLGMKKWANDLRTVLRALSASRATNRALYGDNMSLRELLINPGAKVGNDLIPARLLAPRVTNPVDDPSPRTPNRLHFVGGDLPPRAEPVPAAIPSPAPTLFAEQWCDQCDRRVSGQVARSCRSQFCSLKRCA